MDLGLKDKIALVAASSKGLGKAAAHSLSREGAKVALCGRDPETLDKAAREISSDTGSAVWGHACDVSDPAQATEWVHKAMDHFGGVHILVNNAGGPPPGQFLDFDQQDWENAFRLNLLSTITLSKAALPHMKEQQWGRIINITSVAVKQPIAGLILSNTVRTGVIGLAKSLSNEFARYGVLVNNVCPGYTMTERMKQLAAKTAEKEGVSKEDVIGRWEADIPCGRAGRPEELADLVCFLASERAGYITGVTIQVDGGHVRGTM